jgi:hypothetical protein
MDEDKKVDINAVGTEADMAAKIFGQRDKIQKGRHSYEKQWLVNIAFLHGKQYFNVTKKSSSNIDDRIRWEFEDIERKKKIRRVDNYILPLYRSLLARMLSMKANVTVDATTNSERDKSASKVSQECLEDFWQMANKHNPVLCQQYSGMIRVLAKLFGYLLTVGTAYLKPYFNPKTTSTHFLNGQVGDAEVGEVEVKVKSIFDVYTDPMRRYVIEQDVMDVDEIESLYEVKVSPEEITMSDPEQKIISLMDGDSSEQYENAARILEKWVLPTEKNPQGKYIVCTKNKILYEGGIPEEYKGRIPYFEFTYLDLMLSVFAQGMVEQLVSHQEELNFTVTKLASYKKWMAGKVMVPKGSGLKVKWDDEVGQILSYNKGYKPTYEVPPSPPAFLLQEIIRIRKAMEDISASHDASLGRVPAQAKSGVAIENLAENDNTQLGPILLGIEQQLSFFAETVLDIIESKYTEPRILAITGDLLGAEVKTFRGENVKGNKRIKISLGSSLPYSKSERQKFIMVLQEKGYISQEKARELLEFGDIEGIFHSLDETLQKEENQAMLKPDGEAKVEEWDDHTIHLKILTDFLKSKQFMELDPQIAQKFIDHRLQHQDFLLKEQQAQMQMQMRNNQPPAPGPQGQVI